MELVFSLKTHVFDHGLAKYIACLELQIFKLGLLIL
jgi:hypothetical protein